MMHQALAGLDRLHHRTVRSVETSALITIAAAFAYAERDRIREQVALVKVDQGIRGRYLGGRARSAGRPRPTVNSSRILRSKPPSGGWSSFGCGFRFVRPLVPGLARPFVPISARPPEPGPSPAGGVVLVRVVDRQAVARARRMRRRLSPASSRRWALWTRRSRIASAKVGWSIAACQSATGSWLVTIVERRP